MSDEKVVTMPGVVQPEEDVSVEMEWINDLLSAVEGRLEDLSLEDLTPSERLKVMKRFQRIAREVGNRIDALDVILPEK